MRVLWSRGRSGWLAKPPCLLRKREIRRVLGSRGTTALSRGPWNHVRLDTESSAGVTRLLLCLGYTVSGAGARGAAVAGARRPIAQAKISSETVARVIGGTSFYAPQQEALFFLSLLR